MMTPSLPRCQTLCPVHLVAGDLIVHNGQWWRVISVRFEPDEAAPMVRVFAERYPIGRKANLVLAADSWIPRVLRPGGELS